MLLLPAAAQQRVMRFGGDPSGGAPYMYSDPARPRDYIGYEIDIANALAARLGMLPRFIPTDWEAIVASLKRNEFDIILDGFEPTADRTGQVLFSRPYYIFHLQLTVRKTDTLINSFEDCRRYAKTVGTLVNCAASRLLERDGYNFRSYADPVGAYNDLKFGRLDAVLMDIPMEMFYARSDSALKPAGMPFHTGVYVAGIRLQDTLFKKEVDAALTAMLADGTIEKIMRQWDLWDDSQRQLLTNNASYELTGKSFNWGEGLLHLGKAALVTVLLAFGAMFLAILLGIPLALAQTYGNKTVKAAASIYIEFFRGTPVLVQLLFLYFGLPVLGVTLPGWLTAMVGLGLNYAAYESQVYRSAFQAVPARQWDVAYLLGMRPVLAFRRVIFPQAFRVALPPMTNDFVALFKDTSTAFAISVWELATAYRELANATQSYLLLGAVVCCFYLAMSLPLAHYARKLEKRMQGTAVKEQHDSR